MRRLVTCEASPSFTAQANAVAYQNNPLSWYQAFKGQGTQDFKDLTRFPSPSFGDLNNRRAVGNFNFGASVAAAGKPLSFGQLWAGVAALISNLSAQNQWSLGTGQFAYMNGQYGGASSPNPSGGPLWDMGPGFPGHAVKASDGLMNQGDQVGPNEDQAVALGYLWQSSGCHQ
jgi:hypothetical protein